jgi:hypothetical protein
MDAKFYVVRHGKGGQVREAVPGADAVGVMLPGGQGVEFVLRDEGERLQVYASDRLVIVPEVSNTFELRVAGRSGFGGLTEPAPEGELRDAAVKVASELWSLAWSLEQSGKRVRTTEDRVEFASRLRRLAETLEGKPCG